MYHIPQPYQCKMGMLFLDQRGGTSPETLFCEPINEPQQRRRRILHIIDRSSHIYIYIFFPTHSFLFINSNIFLKNDPDTNNPQP